MGLSFGRRDRRRKKDTTISYTSYLIIPLSEGAAWSLSEVEGQTGGGSFPVFPSI